MANAPESSDAAFTLEGFQASINSDLANVFGNFVNRITKFANSKFNATVPEGGAFGEQEKELLKLVTEKLAEITKYHEEMEFRKAAAETRALWVMGNEYLQTKAPWSLFKTDVEASATGVRIGLNLAALFAITALPFVPETANRLLEFLGINKDKQNWKVSDKWLDLMPAGHEFEVPELLYAKIEDEQVAEWSEIFGGGK